MIPTPPPPLIMLMSSSFLYLVLLAYHFPPYSCVIGYELKKLVKIGHEMIKNKTSNKTCCIIFFLAYWGLVLVFLIFLFYFFFISYFGRRWGGMEIEGWIWWLGWPFFLVLKVKFKLPMLNIVGLFIWSQATIPLLCNKFPCNNCRNCKMLLYQESFIEKTWDLFKCLCFSVTCSYMYDIAYWMKLPFVWSDLSDLICNHELLTVMLTGMGQKMVLHLLFASQMLQYRYLIRVCKRL